MKDWRGASTSPLFHRPAANRQHCEDFVGLSTQTEYRQEISSTFVPNYCTNHSCKKVSSVHPKIYPISLWIYSQYVAVITWRIKNYYCNVSPMPAQMHIILLSSFHSRICTYRMILDHLEPFFSCVRQRGGRDSSPSVVDLLIYWLGFYGARIA